MLNLAIEREQPAILTTDERIDLANEEICARNAR